MTYSVSLNFRVSSAPSPFDRYAINKSLRSSSGPLLQPCGRPPTQRGHEVAGPARVSAGACPHGLQIAVSFCERSGSLPLNSIETLSDPTVILNVPVQCIRNAPCCSEELLDLVPSHSSLNPNSFIKQNSNYEKLLCCLHVGQEVVSYPSVT